MDNLAAGLIGSLGTLAVVAVVLLCRRAETTIIQSFRHSDWVVEDESDEEEEEEDDEEEAWRGK